MIHSKIFNFFLIAVVTLQSLNLNKAGAEAAQSKPDIIVFMLDDLSVTTLQALRHYEASTGQNLLKNFKRYILPYATQFSEAFVSNPVCCPSRSTYLTGQYSHNHRVFTNKSVNGTLLYLNESATLATSLQSSGYYTAHVGKYLNGYGSLISISNSRDLQTSRALSWSNPNVGARSMKLEPSYRPPGWTEWFSALDPTTYCTKNFVINENGKLRNYLKNGEIREIESIDKLAEANGDVFAASKPLPNWYGTGENYQTDIYARRASEIIQRRHSQTPDSPLFLTVMPLAPHIEECALSNRRYLGTPAADVGPVISFSNYYDQYDEEIRPASRHQKLMDEILSKGDIYVKSKGPFFSSPKKSFNEADMSDKPQDIQEKVPVEMNTAQIGQLSRLMASQMASLVAVDDLIGQVLGSLEAQNRLRNAVIVFTSDNGYAFGEHRLTSKLMAYEETAKVPLFIAYPGNQAVVSSKLVLNNDLAPTIAELSGASLQVVPDGRSLVPLLANPSQQSWRRQVLLEHFTSVWDDEAAAAVEKKSFFAIRTDERTGSGPSKLIEHYNGIQYHSGYFVTKPPLDILGYPTVPAQPGFLWSGEKYFDEMYELSPDPNEIKNSLYDLAEQTPFEKLRRLNIYLKLKNGLDLLKGCAGETCRAAEDAEL